MEQFVANNPDVMILIIKLMAGVASFLGAASLWLGLYIFKQFKTLIDGVVISQQELTEKHVAHMSEFHGNKEKICSTL